jgi:hypothetical protein
MIEKISELMCPYCKCARIESEKKESQHTNGTWNEYREFKCGLILHHSPNYLKVFVKQECKKTDQYNEKFDKRCVAFKKIKNYISKLDTDEEFKKNVLSGINHKEPRFW